MTEKTTKASKKAWQEPRVEAVANVRETRAGLVVGTGKEAGTFYAS